MNVTCSHCHTIFRVDPRKVPAEGVRARCSVCRGVFHVAASENGIGAEAATVATVATSIGDERNARPAEPTFAAPAGPLTPPSDEPAFEEPETPAAPQPAEPEFTVQEPSTPTPPFAAPAEPEPVAEAAPPPPASPPSGASAPVSAPPSRAPRFGSQDPHSKARRLARALVSDMVIYHPERQERGLREGSLRKEFKEEIRKSWEEFVEQVGREVAHETPYFRDALNEILARGQKLF